MGCIFCYGKELGSTDLLVCSNCCAKLVQLEPEEIFDLHKDYLETGYTEKASMLEKLIMEGNENGQSSNFKKHINGTRPTRFIGADKKSSLRPTAKKTSTIY